LLLGESGSSLAAFATGLLRHSTPARFPFPSTESTVPSPSDEAPSSWSCPPIDEFGPKTVRSGGGSREAGPVSSTLV
jgi:hypothetical protein